MVLIESAVARVDNLVGLALDLEPADPVQSQIVFVAGAGERTLHMQIADCNGPDAKTDRVAFRNDRFVVGGGSSCGALRLIEKVGEFGARAFETGRVDIGDVVGNDFNVGLLRGHSRRGNRKGSHGSRPQICIRLISR